MNFYDCSEVIDKLKSTKIIIVEGFECTGKSYFIDKLSKFLHYKSWEPYKKVIPYDDRYALGASLIDLVENGIVTEPLIVNRGLPSGAAYNEVYKQRSPVFYDKAFIDYAKSKYSNPDLIHTIYMKHNDQYNAQFLYEKSKDRSDNESYDIFEEFHFYYERYLIFDEVFRKVLDNICKDNYTVISSLDYEVLK